MRGPHPERGRRPNRGTHCSPAPKERYKSVADGSGRASSRARSFPMTLPDRYRRWFEYEQHAHRLTLEALRAVPASLRTTPQVVKAADMFSHIIGARLFWLFRLGEG